MGDRTKDTIEGARLRAADEGRAPWRAWGPYVAERAWGTVREDYSASGDAWGFFPHDHARSRVYRWNEDGMAGICDQRQTFCLALALWNGADPILKERMFGLTGPEGNHGEDVKECWWYLDSTPTYTWMTWRYHYPQRPFPYAELVHHGRGQAEPEYELVDKGLWNDDDGFFYDVLSTADGRRVPMRVRSMVGLLPLCATTTLGTETLQRLPRFAERYRWFVTNRPEARAVVGQTHVRDGAEGRLLSMVGPAQLERILATMLDEAEFLSPHGLRSVSRCHAAEPFVLALGGTRVAVDYEPSESTTGLFGGNSNWRGPVWFPVNVLIIEGLRRFAAFFGEDLVVEHPTGSGCKHTLAHVADDLEGRLVSIFLDEGGRRPVFGDYQLLQSDPRWREQLWLHEYFHGDTGAGLGASHQTG